jgi:UDP-2,3-diacylglucosamine pyrophosphatase LpxH
MLVIISDLHLGDGTTAASIPASAFDLFAKRLRETADFASRGSDGVFRPIKNIDVVLMGDIIDPLHSTRWLNAASADGKQVHPWSDPADPNFASKLLEVTRAILEENKESTEVLQGCANGSLVYLKPDVKGGEQIPIKVRLHYMVGNHDWYYHLEGKAFDQIRQMMIESMGLNNPASPFPYEPDESAVIAELFERYKVLGRHGDCFDKFNFDREKGRNFATLGDAFTMDVCNRFPVEVQKQFGDQLPAGIVDDLRRITNIRPALATPLWISGQIKNRAGSPALENELKKIWDRITDEFLQLDFVHEADKAFQFDIVDAMQLIVKLSEHASFATINDVMVWFHDHMWEVGDSFASYALREPAFLKRTARYVVYGHTHHHEIVPLDLESGAPYSRGQVYFNSGTWHSYFDLAIHNPKQQRFVPYETLTYLTFYLDEEHEERQFETWSGVYE